MAKFIRISQWNANGLSNKRQELEIFLKTYKLDIILISETRFTSKNYISIPGYTIYTTNHPSGKAHGGTAIIIKNTISHYEYTQHKKDFLQATSIILNNNNGPLTISAVYCPPKHRIARQQFEDFFNTLGAKFITGED